MSFPMKCRLISSRPLASSGPRTGSLSPYGKNCAHSSRRIPRGCLFPGSVELLRDVSHRLRLPEIIAVPDLVGSPEVAGLIGKLEVRDAEINHEFGVDHQIIAFVPQRWRWWRLCLS